jgi:sulfur carrier protein ThiS
MRIHVKIHPHLRQCIPSPDKLALGETWDLPEETSAAQVLRRLDLPKGFPVIVMVNGSSCHDLKHTLLKDEDTILVSPIMAGG